MYKFHFIFLTFWDVSPQMLYVSEFLGLISVTYVWIRVCEVQKGTKFYGWLGLEPEMVKAVERKSGDSKKTQETQKCIRVKQIQ